MSGRGKRAVFVRKALGHATQFNVMSRRIMDIFEDIRTQLVVRARLHDDEASITLKGHLLTEYLMDRIVEEKLGRSNRKENASYAKKIEMLESAQLLPEATIANLKHLNKIRNKMAHELDVSVSKSSMLFWRDSDKPMHVIPKKGKYPERYYLRLLSHGILTQLINHMLVHLSVDPRWKRDLA